MGKKDQVPALAIFVQGSLYHTLITAHAHIVHSSRVVDGPPLRPHLAASPPPRPSASSYFYNCNTLHTKELEYTALLLSIELTSHKSQDAEHRVSASLARVSAWVDRVKVRVAYQVKDMYGSAVVNRPSRVMMQMGAPTVSLSARTATCSTGNTQHGHHVD